MSMLQRAIQFATFAHQGQLDRAKVEPYILHSLKVMFAVELEYKENPISEYSLEEMMIAAVLHDVVEDTKYTLENSETLFGSRVGDIVDGVTRRKKQGETYKNFILRSKNNPGSRFVKRVDVKINLARVHTLPVEEQSIRRRYDDALDVLYDEHLEIKGSQL